MVLIAAIVPGQNTPTSITTVSVSTLTPNIIGGITFDPLGATLYVGNFGLGVIEAYPVIRSAATGQITGFGAPTTIAAAPNIDGGLDDLTGVWLWTTYPGNSLGQFVQGSGATAVTSLTAAGVPSSTGGLRIVPAGLPNAGTVLVSSYDAGGIYEVTLTPNASGTYQPVAATLFAATPVGAEGMAFIPTGPYAGSILHANYNNGDVAVVFLDPLTGVPTGVTSVLIGGFQWPMGVAFDPLTDDFFVTAYSSSSNLYHFSGTVVGDYQVNQPAASLDLNGLQGDLRVPAVTPFAPGAPVIVNWSSTNVGLPFDIAVATALVPAGTVFPDGQILNIDLGGPFTWVFGGGFTNAFANASFGYVPPAVPIAGQMGVIDPTFAIGFAISQGNVIQ